jgi:hypothetical protein
METCFTDDVAYRFDTLNASWNGFGSHYNISFALALFRGLIISLIFNTIQLSSIPSPKHFPLSSEITVIA